MTMAALLCQKIKTNQGLRVLPVVLLWLAAWFFLGHPTQVQAEPYLRVCKNGVIYYYFSNQEVNSPQQSFRTPPRFRVKAPPVARKLAPQEIESLIHEASRSHNVPPSLVKAVIRVESNFNPSATSPKGAQGLMQLMPGTADDLLVANPYDPRENISGGVRYLRMLLDRFNNRLPLALAAYNAGPQRVSQRQEVPAIPETQGFVSDVCTEFLKYSGKPPAPR
jgi:soluble lytic murein transglycosylase-like protein